MGWNHLSIPKINGCAVEVWGWMNDFITPFIMDRMGVMGKQFHPTIYWTCDYWSMWGLKSIHVSKRGSWCCLPSDSKIAATNIEMNSLKCLCRLTFSSIYSHDRFLLFTLCYSTKCGAIENVSLLVVLTHWGRDKMVAIFQTTFSNGFSWKKMYEVRLKLHWSLFLKAQLTIFQHWFR